MGNEDVDQGFSRIKATSAETVEDNEQEQYSKAAVILAMLYGLTFIACNGLVDDF